jgi:hypothetical protein
VRKRRRSSISFAAKNRPYQSLTKPPPWSALHLAWSPRGFPSLRIRCNGRGSNAVVTASRHCKLPHPPIFFIYLEKKASPVFIESAPTFTQQNIHHSEHLDEKSTIKPNNNTHTDPLLTLLDEPHIREVTLQRLFKLLAKLRTDDASVTSNHNQVT